MYRRNSLVIGEVYHVFNKSIAGFRIFNNDSEFARMTKTICYYQRERPYIKFSKFVNSTKAKEGFLPVSDEEKLVEIIAYCIMPSHIHLLLKQLKDNGITAFMSNILNSYTRYFNIKHNRKGPLWEGRFKNVLVKTDEQLLHLTRYIHLNPVTAYLVNTPDKWIASSYKEYLLEVKDNSRICKYEDLLEIEPKSYKKFVLDLVSYQRELAKIKKLLLE